MLTITIIIIILTVIISLTAFNNPKITDDLIFTPSDITNRKQFYRFITCAFIHADMSHLFFNMFSFYMFGEIVENTFAQLFPGHGSILFIALYVLSQVLCLIPTYVKHKNDSFYRSLGASGAVSAVIFAGIFIFPMQKVGIIFIPIGVPGFIFGFIYLAITAYLDRKGGGHINHSAHLFGALAGVGLTLIFSNLFSDTNLLSHFIDEIKTFHF